MANKQLTAKVKLNVSDAEKKLKKLDTLFKNLNKTTNSVGGNANLETQLSRSQKQVNNVNNKVKQWANNQKQVTAATKTTNSVLGSIGTKLKGLAATYLGIMGMKAIVNTSDTITSAENRLNSVNGNNVEQTAETMDKIYASAQRARTSYDKMLAGASKTMTIAGDAFQGNMDNAIRFEEIMAKSYTVAGASAEEQVNSMYQLRQALGSGILAGDELRSVREQAPLMYKEIEKFAQGVLKSELSLKDLAAKGVITSDIVVAAVMQAGDTIDEKFEKTKMTFAQAWDSIKNTAIRAFQPVLQMLNNGLRSDAGQTAIKAINTTLVVLANTILWLGNILGTFFNWVAENWSWLSKVILTILTIIGVSVAVLLFPKFIALISFIAFAIKYFIVLGVQAAIAWVAANWALLLIIVIISAVIVALIWLSDGFSDACGIIVGAIMAAIAFVWNLFLSLVELVVGIVNIFTNIFDACANFLANIFRDPIASVIYLFGDMADAVLDIIETIASAIDKLFGSNLAEAVSGWRGSLDAKVTSTAEKYGNGKYEKSVNKINFTTESLGLKRWAYGDAYDKGYQWGESAGNWITDKVSNIGNKLKGDGLPNPTDPNYALNGAYNPNAINDDVLSALDKLGDDTSDIKDSMQLENDDLEYLRRIAEMEWRNEFTTAEIRVDMTNHNTVNGERDLDGIVEYLSDVLRSEMTNVAYGVHY